MSEAVVAASMRHDPEAVESHAPALMRDGRSNRASMRPRPGGGGEQFLTGHPVVNRVRASMRPRPGGREKIPRRRGGTRNCFHAATPGGRGQAAADVRRLLVYRFDQPRPGGRGEAV